VDLGEETASLVPGGDTADGEALDPLNGNIYYECPRVDPHDGGDANLFPGFVTIILGH
jgi:hypothetical protein